jgi:hypothetical protein
LLWLVITVRSLVEEEVVSDWTRTMNEDHGGEVALRVLTKKDRIQWSVLTLMIWLAALGVAGAWLSGHFTYIRQALEP